MPEPSVQLVADEGPRNDAHVADKTLISCGSSSSEAAGGSI